MCLLSELQGAALFALQYVSGISKNQSESFYFFSHFPAAADKRARNHSAASNRYRTGPFHEVWVVTKTELKEDSASGWKYD